MKWTSRTLFAYTLQELKGSRQNLEAATLQTGIQQALTLQDTKLKSK
jgi:hypothetical protein